MKRKDFLKACLALGVVPFLPKLSTGKEKMPLRGCGFRHKQGICYGFWNEDGGEVELVMLDYQRIPYNKKQLSSKPPCWGKPTDSLKKKKEYFANDALIRKLDDYHKRSGKEFGWPTDESVEKYDKISRRRMKRWAKRLSDHLDSMRK